MALSEPQRKYRQDIIETLQLIASRDKQLEYQRQVPVADVSSEIFCQWADDCYQEGKYLQEKWCLPIFSTTELEAMAKFNEILNTVGHSLSEFPWIEQFVLMPEWAELSEAAATALQAFTPDVSIIVDGSNLTG